MAPGLFGCLGFQLFFHKNEDFDFRNKRAIEYKPLGYANDDHQNEEFVVWSNDKLKWALMLFLMTGALVDMSILRLWLSGKLTGSAVAFAFGSFQGKFSRSITDYNGQSYQQQRANIKRYKSVVEDKFIKDRYRSFTAN